MLWIKYYKHLMENIQEDEAVVSLDFSENYSFVVQDEAPFCPVLQ